MGIRRNLRDDLNELWKSTDFKPVLLATFVNVLCWLFLVYSVSVSRSLVLTGAAWLIVFAIFSLASSLISIVIRHRGPTSSYSFGLARAPVLAVFTSTVLAQLSSIFLVKESVERLLEGGEHSHSHKLFIPGTIAASFAQLLAAYVVKNDPFNHVLTAASSSWLQEHAADLSHALCHVVPGLSRFLLPRLNPLGLLAFCNALFCCLAHHLVISRGFWWADPVGALFLSAAVLGTMWPLSTYTGRILLQTAPSHVLNQLDRCLREAGTLDGVLELKAAQFWQLDFDRMVGSVDVRVRRDADEQLVLTHVTEKFHAVVTDLTVQVVKDVGQWQQMVSGGHHGHGHGHSHDHSGHGHSHDHNGHGHSH